MAEYYPLLARAVSAQSNATPEIRNGIYERARKALLGQLRAHEPPVAEEDIERERRALEEAIARVESEQRPRAARPLTSFRPKTAAPIAAAATQPGAEATASPSSPNAAPQSPDPAPEAAPVKDEGDVRKSISMPPRRILQRPLVAPISKRLEAKPPTPPGVAAAVPLSTAPEVRADRPFEANAAAPAIERGGVSAPESAPAPAVLATEKLAPPTSERPIPRSGILRKFARPRVGIADTGPLVVPEPPAGEEQAELAAETISNSSVTPAEQADSSEPDFKPASARPEKVRPTAPLAQVERRRPILAWVVGALAAVLVACVAVLAFALRDNPKTLVAKKPVAIQDADKTPGKIVDRIGVGPTHMSRVPSPGALAESAGVAASPIPAPATPTPAPGSVAPAAQNPSASPVLPVAQRAALLVQSPTANDPQAIATYVGTVVWRLETVSTGPGQPVALAVRAEFDVPDAKFKGSLLFQRNADATLPASHTMELRFSAGPGSPIGAVSKIDPPQMRKEDSPAGDPLSGIATPITSNYFLVGLTKGDPAQANNIDLIRTRAWFDVPMLLANGKIAKITLEKGVAGEKVLNDALASWSQ